MIVRESLVRLTFFTRLALVLLFSNVSCELMETGTGEISGGLMMPLAGIWMFSDSEISNVRRSLIFSQLIRVRHRSNGRMWSSFFIVVGLGDKIKVFRAYQKFQTSNSSK